MNDFENIQWIKVNDLEKYLLSRIGENHTSTCLIQDIKEELVKG